MASKKEHRRKEKNKKRPAEPVPTPPSPLFRPVDELNSLSLLAAIPGPAREADDADDVAGAVNNAFVTPEAGDDSGILAVTGDDDGPAETEEERTEVQAAVLALKDAEAAERARMEAMTAERLRRQAEELTARREQEAEASQALFQDGVDAQAAAGAEEAERLRREAEERLAARREAELEEQRRIQYDAEAAAARQADEAERLRRRAEENEEIRRRQEAEEQERIQRQAAEEGRRREAEAAERARKMAEEAEAARRVAEQIAEARRQAEEAERLQEQARRQNADLRARQMAEAAERVRRMAEKVEAARREAEEAERAYLAAQAAAGVREREAAREQEQLAAMADAGEAAGGESVAARPEPSVEPTPAAPPLEVDNPYWENPPAMYDMMSGSPHDAPSTRADTQGGAAGVLAASLAGDDNRYERCDFIPDESIAEKRLPDDEVRPVPVEKRMYIVMITPEVAPCAKVGGLGDVILGLGRELMKRGHGVEVICPMYSSMRYDQIDDLHEEYAELWCPHYNEWRAEKVYQGKVGGGLQVNFITGGNYTERDSIYGYADDLERFTYFSRQALEFMFKTNRRPDIIHCHDWATGLTPVAYWDVYAPLGWDNSRFVYTIHNNECQGLCGYSEKLLGLIGLNFREYHRPDRLQDDGNPACVNMMKGGIVYSNFVTTVSPTYAGELKTVAGGRGLQNTITRHSAKVGGVLNGIDYDVWNPRTDPKLSARYSEGEDFFEKYANKKALREWLGLYDAWKPIVSVVTRLTHQKGLELIKHAIFATMKRDGQFVLLGSAPDPKVNADFLRLQHELRDNHDCNLYIGYHEDLSRLIYAGSDMFLVPSLYEPCGLTQMISLRYGTVPIVRETGGLVDTVYDLDNSGKGLSEANGFSFRDPTAESLDYGLNRAIRLWYDNPEGFNRLARNGMRYDYSWRHPAEHYENIYQYIKA